MLRKTLFKCLIPLVLLALASCGVTQTAAPTPGGTATETVAPAQPTPTPIPLAQRLEQPLEHGLFEGYTDDDLNTALASIYNGRAPEALSEEERHNAAVLEYALYMRWPYENPVLENNFEEFSFGEWVESDIDGDQTPEWIKASAEAEGVRIQIKDVSPGSPESQEVFYEGFTNPVKSFALVDLNENDPYYEIVISNSTQNGEYYSVFYYYDGQSIVDMNQDCNQHLGKPQDMAYTDEIKGGFGEMTITGDGTMQTVASADIFQTWWIGLSYQLTDDHRLAIVGDLYEPTVDWRSLTLLPLRLYTQRDPASQSFLVEKDVIVRFTRLDNAQWVEATLPDGRSGWFDVNDINAEGGNALDYFYFVAIEE